MCAPSQLSLCTHTPTDQPPAISRFSCNFFRKRPLTGFYTNHFERERGGEGEGAGGSRWPLGSDCSPDRLLPLHPAKFCRAHFFSLQVPLSARDLRLQRMLLQLHEVIGLFWSCCDCCARVMATFCTVHFAPSARACSFSACRRFQGLLICVFLQNSCPIAAAAHAGLPAAYLDLQAGP